ncbi:hypothetical protein FRC00_003954, partial [Tulasnella sp. 408]
MLAEAGDLLAYPLKINRKRACPSGLFAPLLQNNFVNSTIAIQDPHPRAVAATIGPLPLGGIAPLAELPPAIIHTCDSEYPTSAEVVKLYSFAAYLAMVLLLALPILVTGYATTLRKTRAINRLVGLYDAALVHIRAWIFKLRYGFERIFAFVTQLFGLTGLPQSDSISARILVLEKSLALQRAQRLPLDSSPSPSTDSSSPATSATPPSALDSEFNRNFDRIMEALNKRLDRDNKPAADPPFLSPAWVERSRAGTLSFQVNSPSSPTDQTRPRPKSRRVPFGYYDPEPILKMQRLALARRTTLPPLESEPGASDVSPPNTNGLSTTLPQDLLPSLARYTTCHRRQTNSDDAAEKKLEASTPALEPSEPNKLDTDPSTRVSETVSHAKLLETSRLDASGARPDVLTNVQTTTVNKKISQISRPKQPQPSKTDLALKLELSSSAREDGSSDATKTASRALKRSKHNAADADPSAQVSRTVSKASLLARTGLDVNVVLAPSRHMSAAPRPHLNVVEEIQAKSWGQVEGGAAQRQGIPQDSIEKELPNPPFSTKASAFTTSTSQAIYPSGLLPNLGQKALDVPTSTAIVTVGPPTLVALRPILRKATEKKKVTQNKVVTFSEEVQVRDLPMLAEDRDARLSLIPSRKKKRRVRKPEIKEEKQAEGESEMDWEPTPTPALVIARGPGNDAAAQGLSIVQQPTSMEECQGMAANLLFGAAGISQVQSWPSSGTGVDKLGRVPSSTVDLDGNGATSRPDSDGCGYGDGPLSPSQRYPGEARLAISSQKGA